MRNCRSCAGDAFGNAIRARVFEWNREVKRLNEPTDRDEWGMTPQTVNAYYNPTFNEVVFPAAILQPPFFDPNADPAVNYGGIGAVIGHEMGHGFDDQGSQVRRARRAAHLVGAGGHGGLQEAHRFPRRAVRRVHRAAGTEGQRPPDARARTSATWAVSRSPTTPTTARCTASAPPVLDGITADQRFFLSFAQVWRGLDRDEALRSQLLSDPHSPGRFRVNGVVRNVDAWYTAFDVTESDKLYLPPGERVRIW